MPELVIDKQLLFSKEAPSHIANIYNNFEEIKKIFLWIDNFNETEENDAYLHKLVEFLKQFKGKQIINLYGGYFSLYDEWDWYPVCGEEG